MAVGPDAPPGLPLQPARSVANTSNETAGRRRGQHREGGRVPLPGCSLRRLQSVGQPLTPARRATKGGVSTTDLWGSSQGHGGPRSYTHRHRTRVVLAPVFGDGGDERKSNGQRGSVGHAAAPVSSVRWAPAGRGGGGMATGASDGGAEHRRSLRGFGRARADPARRVLRAHELEPQGLSQGAAVESGAPRAAPSRSRNAGHGRGPALGLPPLRLVRTRLQTALRRDPERHPAPGRHSIVPTTRSRSAFARRATPPDRGPAVCCGSPHRGSARVTAHRRPPRGSTGCAGRGPAPRAGRLRPRRGRRP